LDEYLCVDFGDVFGFQVERIQSNTLEKFAIKQLKGDSSFKTLILVFWLMKEKIMNVSDFGQCKNAC
jgi:hypothetical protein